jgi:hypothetical protein
VGWLLAGSSRGIRHCARFAPRYAALGLVAAVLALANLPGARSHRGYCRHGWPCTFLWRRVLGTTQRDIFGLITGNCATAEEGYAARWISVWSLWTDIRRFEASALLADAAVAVAILAAVALATRNWRWKRPRFGRRQLFVVVFVASVALCAAAWAAWRRAAVERLADSLRSSGVGLYLGSPSTEWLTDATGLTLPAFTIEATGLSLDDCAGDPQLLNLRHLTSILSVEASPSTTDVGLREIGRLAGIQNLDLRGARVTDRGLARLRGMRSLECLDLGMTSVTDRGLAHLEGLPCLFILCLDRTMVTGPGLIHVGRLAELEWLCLDNTSVGDDGIGHLVDLPYLEGLELRATRVSDDGLESIRRLTNLKHLDLRDTRVTRGAVSGLRSLLRHAKILYEGDTPGAESGVPVQEGASGLASGPGKGPGKGRLCSIRGLLQDNRGNRDRVAPGGFPPGRPGPASLDFRNGGWPFPAKDVRK